MDLILLAMFIFSILNVSRETLFFILSFFRNDEDEFKNGGKYTIPKDRLIMLAITLTYLITYIIY